LSEYVAAAIVAHSCRLLLMMPTLYKKVHDGVINTMNNASPIQQTLMRSTLRLGKANAQHQHGITVDDDRRSDRVLAPPLGLVDGLKSIKYWMILS